MVVIRLTSGTSSTGMLNKDWDFNIEDKDAEFRDDLRKASGIGRIMAAHLIHDAEEWERLARQSRIVHQASIIQIPTIYQFFAHLRDLGYTQQALYCYRKLYSLDPHNVDALWDRASLAKESADLRTVRHYWNQL